MPADTPREAIVTDPVPDIPRLRKTVEWAEAQAARPDGGQWRQSNWYSFLDAEPYLEMGTEVTVTDEGVASEEGFCKTAFCIAGKAVIDSGQFVLRAVGSNSWLVVYDQATGQHFPWGAAGATVLGLTSAEAEALFAGSNTIEDVRRVAEEIAARVGERL
jgi:hypothetical protein